jgi:lysine-specific permease
LAALGLTAVFGLLSLLCRYLDSGQVFLWLVNMSSLSGFIAWFAIALSHYRFRQRFIAEGHTLSELPYQSRFYPWGPWIAMVMCLVIILGQGFVLWQQPHANPLLWLSTYIGLPVVVLLWWGHRRLYGSRTVCIG